MISIEWLIDALENPKLKWDDIKAQAKEMHKVEIINAADQNQFEDIDGLGICDIITKGEQYYQEKFVSKGSYVNGDIVTKDSIVREVVEDDVEKLAEEFKNQYIKVGVTEHEVSAFIVGYLKAKETLYTKQDVLKAGEIGEINHYDYKHIVSLLDEAKAINQSFKQPKKD